MFASVLLDTRATLRERLLGPGGIDAARIAWAGWPWTTTERPDDGGLWYRESLLPSSVRLHTLRGNGTGRVVVRGLYQVDVIGPPVQGVDMVVQEVEHLLTLFPPSTDVTRSGGRLVRIVGVALLPVQVTTEDVMGSVRIEWTTDVDA